MSLLTRITALINSIATDIKDVYAKIGNLNTLQTTTKSSLVGAINEIKAFGGLQINDSTPSAVVNCFHFSVSLGYKTTNKLYLN